MKRKPVDIAEIWGMIFGCPYSGECVAFQETADPGYWRHELCRKKYRKCLFWWTKSAERGVPLDEIWED